MLIKIVLFGIYNAYMNYFQSHFLIIISIFIFKVFYFVVMIICHESTSEWNEYSVRLILFPIVFVVIAYGCYAKQNM